ncbi:MAG: exosortase-associated EpsI family protein [Anaerolineae bacterium]|nr:exosortase-associated EpsI family protein [Anaerolineae bacterium]
MLANTRRYLVVIALLGLGLLLAWRAPGRQRLDSPAAGSVTPGEPSLPEYTYFVDIEGWYRITPQEAVLRSVYDLSGQTTEATAAALPRVLGEWHQVGEDKYLGDDPAVIEYLNHPTVALERTYQHADGQRLILALLGNKGEDSFLLFSHTPETCYPGRLWQTVDSRSESTSIAGQAVHVRYLLAEHLETQERLVVMFWYLWDNPERDAQEGVLSMRINLWVPPGESEQAVLAYGWDFFERLFPVALPWERF